MSHRLSKSRYTAGVQCHKLLWWKVHEPLAVELQPNKVLQDRFDQGAQVGALARDRFPGGVLIDLPHTAVDEQVRRTPFMARCWPKDRDHIKSLSGVGPKKGCAFLLTGVHRIADLPAKQKLNVTQQRQIRAIRENRLIVEPGLKQALEAFRKRWRRFTAGLASSISKRSSVRSPCGRASDRGSRHQRSSAITSCRTTARMRTTSFWRRVRRTAGPRWCITCSRRRGAPTRSRHIPILSGPRFRHCRRQCPS